MYQKVNPIVGTEQTNFVQTPDVNIGDQSNGTALDELNASKVIGGSETSYLDAAEKHSAVSPIGLNANGEVNMAPNLLEDQFSQLNQVTKTGQSVSDAYIKTAPDNSKSEKDKKKLEGIDQKWMSGDSDPNLTTLAIKGDGKSQGVSVSNKNTTTLDNGGTQTATTTVGYDTKKGANFGKTWKTEREKKGGDEKAETDVYGYNLGYKDGEYSVSANQEKVNTDGSGRKTSGTITADGDSGGFQGTNTNTSSSGNSTTTTGKVSLSSNEIAGDGSVTWLNKDGAGQSAELGGSLGPDGEWNANMGAYDVETIKDKDGKSTGTVKNGVGVTVANDEAGVNVKWKNGDGTQSGAGGTVFFDDNGEVNGGKVAYGQGKHSGSATFEQEDGTTTVGANYNYGRNGASGTVSVSDEEVSGQVSIKAGPVGVTGGGSVTTDKAGTEVIGGNPTYDAMQGQTAELVTNTNGYDWNAGVSATAYGLTASMGYGQNSSNTDAYGNYLLSGDELQARQDQLVMGPMSVDELQTGDIIKSTDREGDQLTGGVNFLGLVGVNGSSSDQNRQTSTMVVHDDQIAVDIGEGDTHSGSVTWRSKDIS